MRAPYSDEVMEEENPLYQLNSVAHVDGNINKELGIFIMLEKVTSCPETYTFHMSFGECTIMLRDMAYQLGLLVDGEVVNGDKNGNRIHLRWLLYVAKLDELGNYSRNSAALA
ncbi:hypothetical protein Ahy_A06g027682 [Arachis hypogaea]|uniref:Aminotransferase-like plant mobile domain-containing protein n=1 Tax=Arachis hypogaea TaxID=3818 RepID=A0A445CPK7_ARAHY|nr:hypothetical protein Ahy_A06g027682 [Arachis hypogaea]